MNILEHLNVEETLVSKSLVEMTLEIADIHKQPFGFVHGGLNGLLIETACSVGANQNLEGDQFSVGVNLEVSHLVPAQTGFLKVVATPDKIGQSLQFWSAEVFNDKRKIATGKCILANKKQIV